jgi:small-conductance mechanosensitive channel
VDLLYGNSLRNVVIAAAISATVLLLVWVVRVYAGRKLKNARETVTDFDDFLLDVAKLTKLFLLFIPALDLGIRALEVRPDKLYGLIRTGTKLSLIAQTALWVTGVIDFLIRRYRRSRLDTDPSAVMTMHVFRVAAVSAVWIFGIVSALANVGVEVAPLIAGLGIGGIAVALALQNILGDLFASLSIVVDKPFVLGDPISVDGHSGTVEHIGLKTTRLRASGGEQLILSNGDLLKSRIRNFKRMAERRATMKLAVSQETDPETLARIPLLLKAAVEKQERARFERAHFVAFGEQSFDFELTYHVTTPDYGVYLDTQQAVNLDILRALQAENVSLAHRVLTMPPPGT